MKLESHINLLGYELLGQNRIDGIRYTWRGIYSRNILESAAFIHHSKGKDTPICGYTTSVSMGCVLRTTGLACKFCRTGKVLPFSGILSTFDLAKQNILMVLFDMYCTDNHQIKDFQREFAYMGQGEPGYSYSQLRLAIKLTNCIMAKLGQQVYRHIIATCGVIEMIDAYIYDISSNFFDSRVTMHFSLHGMTKRNMIMPINIIYPYQSVIKRLNSIAEISGEKPCIGILLFKNFKPLNSKDSYSNLGPEIDYILNELDPTKFRLSFCEYNGASDIGYADTVQVDEYEKVLEKSRQKGFDAKLFSSFGKKEYAACGMLGGKPPVSIPGKKWIELEKYAEELIAEVI